MRSFVKDLARALPNAEKVNRGKLNIEELATYAYQHEFNKIIIVGSRKGGNPGSMRFIEVLEDEYRFFPFNVVIGGTKLIREFEEASVPGEVRTAVVAYIEGSGEHIQVFAEALGEVLEIPVTPVSSVDEVPRGVDNVILITPAARKYLLIMRFVNPRNLKPSGPEIRVERFYYAGVRYG